MKKTIFTLQLALLSSVFTVFGQLRMEGKIGNLFDNIPPMDIVLFLFGMENPVKVGKVDKQGIVTVEFPDSLPASISTNDKMMFAYSLPQALFFTCFELEHFSDSISDVRVYKGGYFSLAHKNKSWAGTIFPVSNLSLIPWLEDRYYQNPVIASFYEAVFCERAINLITSCRETIQYDKTELTVDYNYSLQLKRGFNLIEYKIETLKEVGVSGLPSIPSLVTIKNAGNLSALKWHVKYYYSNFKME